MKQHHERAEEEERVAAAEARAAAWAARADVLEGALRSLVASAFTRDDLRLFLMATNAHFTDAGRALRTQVDDEYGPALDAARAALASAPGECETCGGSGVFRFGPDCRGNPGGEQECPPCSGTGRAPGETAREVLDEAINYDRLESTCRACGEYWQAHAADCERHKAVDAALARLAALAPPSAEAEALRAALAFARATAAVAAHAASCEACKAAPVYEECMVPLVEAQRATEAAAVEALRALEGRTK